MNDWPSPSVEMTSQGRVRPDLRPVLPLKQLWSCPIQAPSGLGSIVANSKYVAVDVSATKRGETFGLVAISADKGEEIWKLEHGLERHFSLNGDFLFFSLLSGRRPISKCMDLSSRREVSEFGGYEPGAVRHCTLHGIFLVEGDVIDRQGIRRPWLPRGLHYDIHSDGSAVAYDSRLMSFFPALNAPADWSNSNGEGVPFGDLTIPRASHVKVGFTARGASYDGSRMA